MFSEADIFPEIINHIHLQKTLPFARFQCTGAVICAPTIRNNQHGCWICIVTQIQSNNSDKPKDDARNAHNGIVKKHTF